MEYQVVDRSGNVVTTFEAHPDDELSIQPAPVKFEYMTEYKVLDLAGNLKFRGLFFGYNKDGDILFLVSADPGSFPAIRYRAFSSDWIEKNQFIKCSLGLSEFGRSIYQPVRFE